MNRIRNPWNWLTCGATAFALLLCFWGKTQHIWAMLVFLVPCGLRLYFSPAFRHDMADLRRRLWQTCEDYPLRRSSPPLLAAATLVVVPAGLFFLANNYVDEGDNVPVMLAAASLASEGDWELSEFLDRPDDFCYLGNLLRTDKGTYSNYPSGPVQFALPVVLVSKLVGGDYLNSEVLRKLQKWTAAWLSAACLGLFFLTCLHLVDARPAWVITLLLTTGSAMYTTIGQGLWQHGGILFWSQLVVFLEFRRTVHPARSTLWLQGLALGFMPACRLSAVIVMVPLIGWVLVRDWRRGLALGFLAAICYLPWAWLNFSIYGQPFGPSTGQLAGFSWQWDRFVPALEGVLFSPGRGFFIYQIWGILAAGTLFAMIHRGTRRPEKCPCPAGWQAICFSIFALNLAMVSAWINWWGGWCWGSRLLSDSLLMFALLCVRPVAQLWQHLQGRRLIVAMAAIGFLLHAPYIYFKAEQWNGAPADIDRQPQRLWSWREPPFLNPIQRVWHAFAK